MELSGADGLRRFEQITANPDVSPISVNFLITSGWATIRQLPSGGKHDSCSRRVYLCLLVSERLNEMKRIFLVVSIVTGTMLVGCERPPRDAEIAALEATIKLDQLPHSKEELPRPLSRYARYYTAAWNGERTILGELVLMDTPGVYVVSSRSYFPKIFDGGCAVVNLVYSVPKQRMVSIKCNGYA